MEMKPSVLPSSPHVLEGERGARVEVSVRHAIRHVYATMWGNARLCLPPPRHTQTHPYLDQHWQGLRVINLLRVWNTPSSPPPFPHTHTHMYTRTLPPGISPPPTRTFSSTGSACASSTFTACSASTREPSMRCFLAPTALLAGAQNTTVRSTTSSDRYLWGLGNRGLGNGARHDVEIRCCAARLHVLQAKYAS